MSANLAEPWESTKLIPSQSSTIPVSPGVEWMTSRKRSSSASAVAKKRPPSSRITATPGNTWSPGCSSSSRKTGPLLAPESRHARVATDTSQMSESPIPMITPASTPKTSVPRIAATAIQKSNLCTWPAVASRARSSCP